MKAPKFSWILMLAISLSIFIVSNIYLKNTHIFNTDINLQFWSFISIGSILAITFAAIYCRDNFLIPRDSTKLSWILLSTTSILIIWSATGFVVDTRLFTDTPYASNHLFGDIYIPHLVSNILLYLHILPTIPAFVLGPLMFHETFRNQSLRFHRIGGWVYVVGALICAASGHFLALCNTQGVLAKMGFGTLGLMLFLTTWQGMIAGMRKKIIEHRVWMIRSYALMFAFFTVKLYFFAWGHYFHDKVDPNIYKQILSWGCWVFNLTIAEFYIANTDKRGNFVGRENAAENYKKNRLFEWKPSIK